MEYSIIQHFVEPSGASGLLGSRGSVSPKHWMTRAADLSHSWHRQSQTIMRGLYGIHQYLLPATIHGQW